MTLVSKTIFSSNLAQTKSIYMKKINYFKGITLLSTFCVTSLFAQQKSTETPNPSNSKISVLNPSWKKSNSNKALCAVAIDCSDNDAILNITYSTINNTTTCSPNGYGDYQIMTANVTAGVATPISVTVGDGWTTESVSAWVDYNGDESFTEDEFIYIGTGSGNTITSTITIPANTPAGFYPIRFMVYAGNADPELGCYNEPEDYGEFEDYTLNVTAAPPCDVLPTSVLLAGTPISACVGEVVSFTLDYTITDAGASYQLQTSVDGTTWNDTLAIFYTSTFDLDITQTKQYRVVLTCSENSTSVTSNAVTITLKSANECYCFPELDCTDGDLITTVEIPSVSFTNTSTCGTDGYSDYTALPIAGIAAGSSTAINVTVGSGFTSESVSVWIDYNDNGVFEASEFTYIGTGSGSVVSGTIPVPAAAPLGDHRMRVRVAAVGQTTATDDMACDDSQTYGETEDYTIEIIAGGDVGLETTSLQNVVIFPNPTNGIFTVSQISTQSTIEVLDLTGRVISSVKTQNGVDTTIDLSTLATGTYHVVISNENAKVVKQVVRN